MAQEQKESIDRTFDQFMQSDLGFRTGVRRVKMFHDTNKLYFEIHFCSEIVAWDEKNTQMKGQKETIC